MLWCTTLYITSEDQPSASWLPLDEQLYGYSCWLPEGLTTSLVQLLSGCLGIKAAIFPACLGVQAITTGSRYSKSRDTSGRPDKPRIKGTRISHKTATNCCRGTDSVLSTEPYQNHDLTTHQTTHNSTISCSDLDVIIGTAAAVCKMPKVHARNFFVRFCSKFSNSAFCSFLVRVNAVARSASPRRMQ